MSRSACRSWRRNRPLQSQRQLQRLVSSSLQVSVRDAGTAERDERELRTILRWTSWGSLLPVVGWVYGVGTLWTSRRFSRRDKVVGSLLFPGGWFGGVRRCRIDRECTPASYCWTASVGRGRLLPARHRVRLRRPGLSDGRRDPADPGRPGRGRSGPGLPQGPLARLSRCPRVPISSANECDDRSREDGHGEFSTFGRVDGGPGARAPVADRRARPRGRGDRCGRRRPGRHHGRRRQVRLHAAVGRRARRGDQGGAGRGRRSLLAGHRADDLRGLAQPGPLDDVVLRAVHRGLGSGLRRDRDVVVGAADRRALPRPLAALDRGASSGLVGLALVWLGTYGALREGDGRARSASCSSPWSVRPWSPRPTSARSLLGLRPIIPDDSLFNILAHRRWRRRHDHPGGVRLLAAREGLGDAALHEGDAARQRRRLPGHRRSSWWRRW